jgi:hypothetical protein
MPDIKKGFKIWLPRARTVFYSVEIDGIDITSEIISAEFTRGLIGVETLCKVTLIDSDGDYAALYTGGETIEFKCDFVDGTTSYWKGTLEKPVKKFGAAYTLELIGSHYQSDLLDKTVTAEFDGNASADNIIKELVDKYLTGYTYANVNFCNVSPKIKWSNKPFFDCLLDLCDLSGFDCYLDNAKDIHFFERESIENNTQAIIWNDNLIDIISFGADNLDVRNRIIVYGEDETGLPIVYQADDSVSQAKYRIKDKVVKDSSIRNYNHAKELGDALLLDEKEKANKGELNCLLLPDIAPGEKIWITNPVQGIEDQFRILKYTTKIPIEQTTVIISKEKTIPSIFKERKKAELSAENLINPYEMTGSLNLTFDNTSEYDLNASSDVTISEGNLKTNGTSEGTMVSARRRETENITRVHVKVIGDALSGTIYYISTDDGNSYELITLETSQLLTSPGKNLRLKIVLNSANTLIDSVAVLYK